MPDHITSHNQSGGITAKTVNVGGGGPRPPERKDRWKVVLGVLSAAAAIATILTFLGIAW